MSKFLDEFGLAHAWDNIKSYVKSQTMPISYLTSSEYDVLPSTQKNHGLYFVTSAPIAAGDTVNWAGYDWIVVNDNGDNTVVLAMNEIYELTVYGKGQSNGYVGSTLALRAKELEDSLSSDELLQTVDTTVNGVTSKIFVFSKSQAEGGFSYFTGNNSRKCKYNNNPFPYWTSDAIAGTTSILSIITGDGMVENRYSFQDSELGFRPFVTIKQPEQKTTVYLNGTQISL